MAVDKLTVVLSQAQGKDPAKRELEEGIAAALTADKDVDVRVVPHLYDMPRDHGEMLSLHSVQGELVVLAWLYPRATRWILDRNGVKGDVPGRKIHCLDLRAHDDPTACLDEIERIVGQEKSGGWHAQSEAMGVVIPSHAVRKTQGVPPDRERKAESGKPKADQPPTAVNRQSSIDNRRFLKRRWYPVIDYERCTDCMECIDFCLFGVFGIDHRGRILVEDPESCKKGCPACSRVCPEHAIIFPGHKTPAIAGADGEVTGLKIDLSQLFGAPSALETAAQERDVELLKNGGAERSDSSDGRATQTKRQAAKTSREHDELDDLIDELDGLDL